MPKYDIHPSVAERIDRIFSYHPPKGDQRDRYVALRAKAREFAVLVVENTPYCSEQTTSIERISEACMYANAAIARHEDDALAAAEVDE